MARTPLRNPDRPASQHLYEKEKESRVEDTERCHRYPFFHFPPVREHPGLIWTSTFVAFSFCSPCAYRHACAILWWCSRQWNERESCMELLKSLLKGAGSSGVMLFWSFCHSFLPRSRWDSWSSSGCFVPWSDLEDESQQWDGGARRQLLGYIDTRLSMPGLERKSIWWPSRQCYVGFSNISKTM